MIGFYSFTSPPPPVILTLKQRIANLSAAQKTGVLEAFCSKDSVTYASRNLKIDRDLVYDLYNDFDRLQITARSYMRGKVVIVPPTYNPDGSINTPPVYNTPPATESALTTTLDPLFPDFNSTQVDAITAAMVKWSKYDGTGNWAFYQSQIIL
jgi:hypothetical protein